MSTTSTPDKKEEIDRKHGGMLLDVEVEDGIGEEVSVQVKIGRTKSPATKKRYHQITISTPSKRTKSSSSTDIDDQQKGGGGGGGSKSSIGEGRVGNKSSSIAIVQLKGGVRTITTISGGEEEPMTAEEQLQKLVKKFEMMSVATAADDDFDVSSIYPYLAESLQLENVFRVDAATLAHAKKNLRLMGSSKMKEFDDKWSKLQEEQIELSLSSKRDDILSNLIILSKQNELMYQQLTILIDAMSTTGFRQTMTTTGKKEEIDESKKHGGMLLDVDVEDGEEVSIQVKIGMTKTITSEVSSATPEIIRTKEIYHHIPISTPPKKTPSSSTAIDDQQKGGARTMTTISTGDPDADVVGSEQEILGFEMDKEEEEMFRKLKNLST